MVQEGALEACRVSKQKILFTGALNKGPRTWDDDLNLRPEAPEPYLNPYLSTLLAAPLHLNPAWHLPKIVPALSGSR